MLPDTHLIVGDIQGPEFLERCKKATCLRAFAKFQWSREGGRGKREEEEKREREGEAAVRAADETRRKGQILLGFSAIA